MSRPIANIMLPAPRHAQLKTLADSQGLSVTGMIEALLDREIKAGRLADSLPGFEVHVREKRVWLTTPASGLPPVNAKQARQIADALDRVATTARGQGRAVKMQMADGMTAIIARAGKGMVIVVEDEQLDRREKASLTLRMAQDFARNIRTAAATVEI